MVSRRRRCARAGWSGRWLSSWDSVQLAGSGVQSLPRQALGPGLAPDSASRWLWALARAGGPKAGDTVKNARGGAGLASRAMLVLGPQPRASAEVHGESGVRRSPAHPALPRRQPGQC